MRVTLIADASFCSFTGAAGYGWWAASERGKRGGGGAMRDKVCSSSAAEMIAVVNGLHMAIKFELVQQGDHVLLQTDCMAALDGFQHRRSKQLNKSELAAFKKLYELKKQHRLTYSFRHVKGHSNIKEARYITNNLCDERAKVGMRLARRRFGGIHGEDK
jgi:ribonuclease HI